MTKFIYRSIPKYKSLFNFT